MKMLGEVDGEPFYGTPQELLDQINNPRDGVSTKVDDESFRTAMDATYGKGAGDEALAYLKKMRAMESEGPSDTIRQ